ncbi:hypothetical protein ABGB12_24765 [Actinocorallia sp. B10E7]|uniref:hypothetical protein n=1 Tax=Actinocorallia sp. B10E7 TaxID=3153558 RepID=UPI00325E5035
MNRRTDQAIALTTIIAVALIPTAALALVKVGGGFDAGRPSESSVTPVTENYPGAPKPAPMPTQTQQPIALPPIPSGADPAAPPSSQPPANKPLPAELTSFKRYVGIARIDSSGATSTQEEALFTMKPRFTMTATTTEYVLKGQKWKPTGVTKVVIKNRVKATRHPDGTVDKEPLTPEEIDQLKYEADPRTLTRNIKNVPGVKKSRDPKTKLYKYVVDLSAGENILDKLPPDVMELLPKEAALLGMKAELHADAKDHTFFAALNGATVVNALGVGVIYAEMK